MIQPEIPNGMPVMNVIGEAPWMCITRITGRRRSPILSGFKDDLFNLEMENTAYESLKSSLPLPMDNSLDAYRLKSTRSPAQKLEVGVQADGLDEYDDRGVRGDGEDTIFVATADTR
jgi:hypothetical protein